MANKEKIIHQSEHELSLGSQIDLQSTFTHKSTAFNTINVLRVVASDEHSIALLRRAYEEIYVPAFPYENERDSLEKIESRLRNPLNGVKRVILIAGNDLKMPDPLRAELAAIAIAYYYSSYAAGLLAYNAVSPHFRNAGIGRLMVEERIRGLQSLATENGQSLQSVIIEVNNPSKVRQEQDSMDPTKRIALFEKWGARLIPIDYVQPPLAHGSEKGKTSLLMAYPIDGRYPNAVEVAAFISGIWQANNNASTDYRSDPDYLKMLRQLEHWRDFGDHSQRCE